MLCLRCFVWIPPVAPLHYLITAIAAYFVGSIPTGFLIAKSRGVDIRKVGSGNMGATNVFRALGKKAGTFVLIVDLLKGCLGCLIVGGLILQWAAPSAEDLAQARERVYVVAGVCAILGHNFTCWLNFKGGKGIATSAGVMLAWVPLAFLGVLIVWLSVFLTSRYVSLASILAAIVLPIITWLIGAGHLMITVTICLSLMAIYKHRTNIQRLLAGTENRFVKKKKEEAQA